MKRSAFFAILLAVLLLMTACGGADGDGGSHDENNGIPNDTPNGPQEDGTQTETPDAGEDGSTEEDENGAVALDLSADGKMTVTVSIGQASGKDVSVVVVKDSADASLWQSNPEKVLALGQLTLDEEGKGSISLPVCESTGYAVLVCYDGGSELAVWQ